MDNIFIRQHQYNQHSYRHPFDPSTTSKISCCHTSPTMYSSLCRSEFMAVEPRRQEIAQFLQMIQMMQFLGNKVVEQERIIVIKEKARLNLIKKKDQREFKLERSHKNLRKLMQQLENKKKFFANNRIKHLSVKFGQPTYKKEEVRMKTQHSCRLPRNDVSRLSPKKPLKLSYDKKNQSISKERRSYFNKNREVRKPSGKTYIYIPLYFNNVGYPLTNENRRKKKGSATQHSSIHEQSDQSCRSFRDDDQSRLSNKMDDFISKLGKAIAKNINPEVKSMRAQYSDKRKLVTDKTLQRQDISSEKEDPKKSRANKLNRLRESMININVSRELDYSQHQNNEENTLGLSRNFRTELGTNKKSLDTEYLDEQQCFIKETEQGDDDLINTIRLDPQSKISKTNALQKKPHEAEEEEEDFLQTIRLSTESRISRDKNRGSQLKNSEHQGPTSTHLFVVEE